MKNVLTSISITALLAGCSPFNTVQLMRYEGPLQKPTPIQTFMEDRQGCLDQARKCIAEKYKNTIYMTETVDKLLPSRGVYLSCMTGKGYVPVQHSGYVPDVLVKMHDYAPERDCAGR